MRKTLFSLMFILAIIVYARLSFFSVDAAEYAYVTVLGKHTATYDGAKNEEAGLKFGWPWPIQQVQRLDRRLQQFDLPELGQLTRDKKGKNVDKLLNLEAFVCWKIASKRPNEAADADPVGLFIRRIGSTERAMAVLNSEITGKLGAAVGQLSMDELVNADPADDNGKTIVDITLAKLHDSLMQELQLRLRDKYGIELVDIRLRRFNHPASVRESNFQRIRAERANVAAQYETQGEQIASKIRSEAKAAAEVKLADANSKASEIKSKAVNEANKVRNDAVSQDKEFYAFLKSLERLQAIVGSPQTVLYLSTHRPLFDSLFSPPRPKPKEGK